MRILFICPNRQKFVHAVPPIGVLYLTSNLIEKGHTVKVLDLMYSKDSLKEIEGTINEFSPQIIGISIRNIDTLFSKEIFEIPDIKKYIEKIREISQSILILGGAGFSIFAEEIVQYLEADYGIKGEADVTLPLFIEHIEKNSNFNALPGLVYRKDGKIVSNPSHLVEDLDAIPFQAIDLIDYKKYGKARGCFGVFTRKGCPMDCIFCPEQQVHGYKSRLRSAKRVVDEIEYILDRTGIPYFDFADSLFNVPREHAMNVCQEIVDRKVKIKFEVELSPNGQDEESVKLLKAAGCIGVDLTAESGSESMLKILRKGYTTEMVIDVSRLYQRYKILYTVGFLLGGPGENLKTIEETIGFTKKLPGVSCYYFGVGMRVFKGTRLEEHYFGSYALSTSMIDKNKKDLFKLNFFVDQGFDNECANRLIELYRNNMRCIICDMLYEDYQFLSLKIADKFNIRPIWRYGWLPRIFERVMHIGFVPELSWNQEERKFCKV